MNGVVPVITGHDNAVMADFRLALAAWRKSRGISQIALSNDAGLGKNAVGDYENGRVSPTLDSLTKIAECLGIAVAELVEGPSDQPADQRPAGSGRQRSSVPPGFHVVPLFESIPAGGWSAAMGEVVGEYCVPDWLIPNKPGVVGVRVRGDSMAPRIEDGAIAFIDTRRHDARSGEIVAAVLDGEATLKVYRIRNRVIVLEPWNRTRYSEIVVDDPSHLRIIGVYVGHWTSL